MIFKGHGWIKELYWQLNQRIILKIRMLQSNIRFRWTVEHPKTTEPQNLSLQWFGNWALYGGTWLSLFGSRFHTLTPLVLNLIISFPYILVASHLHHQSTPFEYGLEKFKSSLTTALVRNPMCNCNGELVDIWRRYCTDRSWSWRNGLTKMNGCMYKGCRQVSLIDGSDKTCLFCICSTTLPQELLLKGCLFWFNFFNTSSID